MGKGSTLSGMSTPSVLTGTPRSESGVSDSSRASRREEKHRMQMREEKNRRAEEQLRNDRAMARYMLNQSNAKTKIEKDDIVCNQLFTRVLGTACTFLGLFFSVIATIVLAQPCCGDNWSFNQSSWDQQCSTPLDNSLEPFAVDDTENRSCYHRNITGLVILVFVMIFFTVGSIVICYGECAYDYNEDKDDQKIENTAAHLKWIQMEQMEAARREEMEIEMARREREEEKERLQDGLNNGSGHRNLTHQPRRYSIGSPSTPSQRHQNHFGGSVSVVQSHPYVYGNSRPYEVM